MCLLFYPSQQSKKYFKRSDLAEKEKEEYEKAHNIKRIKDEQPSTSSGGEIEDLAAIGPDEDKLPMTLSRQEVQFFVLHLLKKSRFDYV